MEQNEDKFTVGTAINAVQKLISKQREASIANNQGLTPIDTNSNTKELNIAASKELDSRAINAVKNNRVDPSVVLADPNVSEYAKKVIMYELS